MEVDFHDIDELDDENVGAFGLIPDELFADIDEIEGQRALGDWELYGRIPITIDIEPISSILLDHARQEVNLVMDNVLRMIPNAANRDAGLTPNDFFKVWFDRCLMDSILLWLAKYMDQTISIKEIKSFIKVELLLAFYNCTPEKYYDKRYKKRYNPNENEMTLQRYKQIMHALSVNETPNSNVRKRNLKNLMQWEAPFSPNKDLEDAMATFRAATAKIAFIRGVTKAVIDDDLLRMRSRLIAMFGFTQINNPAKGLGIVHHGIVSIVTSLFLCGHVQRRNETTTDAVTILQQTLSGASVERLINLSGNHFMWDRGYGGPDGIINRTSVTRGLDVSGTAKRVPSFPFTFGSQVPGPRRLKIQEAGSEAMYWARKYIPGTEERISTSQYALGFRSGLGRVALMQTTYRKCGPGKYAFLTHSGKDNSHSAETKRIRKNSFYDDFYKFFEEKEVERLTMGQSTPEWFLLRKFCFTGTTAEIAWTAAQYDDDIHYFVAEVLAFLGIEVETRKIVRNYDLHIIVRDLELPSSEPVRYIDMNDLIFLIEPEVMADEEDRSQEMDHSQTDNVAVNEPQLHRDESLPIENITTDVVTAMEQLSPPNETAESGTIDNNSNEVGGNGSGTGSPQLVPIAMEQLSPPNETAESGTIDNNSNEVGGNGSGTGSPQLVPIENPVFPYSKTRLRALHVDTLRDHMKEYGLNTDGNKNDLITRMTNYMDANNYVPSRSRRTQNTADSVPPGSRRTPSAPDANNSTATQSVRESGQETGGGTIEVPDLSTGSNSVMLSMMGKWFMAPRKNTSEMKIGKANESNVIQMLPTFMSRRSPYRVHHIEEYGLLSNREYPELCVSPDGIMLVEFGPNHGDLSLLEIKTKVSKVEAQKEYEMQRKYGHFHILDWNCDTNDFRNLIPNKEHRVQMLHGMAVTHCEHGFYVVAAPHEIIRVVVIRISYKFLAVYRGSLNYLWKKSNLEWINTGDVPNTFTQNDFETGKLKHAVDKHTIEQTLDLYHSMRNKIKERRLPFPNGRMIVPSLVALWNKCKGPIDIYSRFLCDSHAKHKKQSANGRIWIRSIMSCVYNAYISYLLYHSIKFLNSPECRSYGDYQRKRRETAPFDLFISDLIDEITDFVGDDVHEGGSLQPNVTMNDGEEESEYIPPAPHIKHNRRRLFVDDGDYVQFRLNQNHTKLKVTGQRVCVVCCRNTHTDPNHETYCKKRKGLKSKYICRDCNVPLCVIPRYDGRSCFWWFHNSLQLPECCTPEADMNITVTRRENVNASRSENGSSNGDSDSDNFVDEGRTNQAAELLPTAQSPPKERTAYEGGRQDRPKLSHSECVSVSSESEDSDDNSDISDGKLPGTHPPDNRRVGKTSLKEKGRTGKAKEKELAKCVHSSSDGSEDDDSGDNSSSSDGKLKGRSSMKKVPSDKTSGKIIEMDSGTDSSSNPSGTDHSGGDATKTVRTKGHVKGLTKKNTGFSQIKKKLQSCGNIIALESSESDATPTLTVQKHSAHGKASAIGARNNESNQVETRRKDKSSKTRSSKEIAEVEMHSKMSTAGETTDTINRTVGQMSKESSLKGRKGKKSTSLPNISLVQGMDSSEKNSANNSAQRSDTGINNNDELTIEQTIDDNPSLRESGGDVNLSKNQSKKRKSKRKRTI